MADDDWKTAASRQSVVDKLIEEKQKSTMTYSQTEVEMENSIFQTARTKVEYFYRVAKLVTKFRENKELTDDRRIKYYSAFIPGTEPPRDEDKSWRKPEFRQAMVKKVNDVFEKMGMPPSDIGKRVEKSFYEKARAKEEYLGYLDCYISNIVDNANYKWPEKRRRPTPYQRPAAQNGESNH